MLYKSNNPRDMIFAKITYEYGTLIRTTHFWASHGQW